MNDSRQTLALFRRMMRSARKFSDYNFRDHAIRRIRYGFRTPTRVSSFQEISQMASVIERQSIISRMYQEQSSVIHEFKR